MKYYHKLCKEYYTVQDSFNREWKVQSRKLKNNISALMQRVTYLFPTLIKNKNGTTRQGADAGFREGGDLITIFISGGGYGRGRALP